MPSRLELKREEYGLSQEQCAELFKVSLTTYQRWEKACHFVHQENRRKLQVFLGELEDPEFELQIRRARNENSSERRELIHNLNLLEDILALQDDGKSQDAFLTGVADHILRDTLRRL